MLQALIPLAGAIGFGIAKGVMRKRAFNTLIKRGLLTEGSLKYGSGGANALLNKLGRGMNPARAAQRAMRDRGTWSAPGRSGGSMFIDRGYGRWNGRIGQMAQTNSAGYSRALGEAEAVFAEAGGLARKARAFGGAEKMVGAYFGVDMGFSLFSNADRLFNRNIPAPAQEIMQTQQAFMPRQAHTQRQRAIQAIHQSGMTTRSALGHEAMYMHG